MEGPYDGYFHTTKFEDSTRWQRQKPAIMKDSEWEEADQKALSTIQLSITDVL